MPKLDSFLPILLQKWKGWRTEEEYDKLEPSDLVLAQNIDFDGKTALRPRKGSQVLGAVSTAQTPFYFLFTPTTSSGDSVMFGFRDTAIEWYNRERETWETLKSNLVSGNKFAQMDRANDDYLYLNDGAGMARIRLGWGFVDSNTAIAITLQSRTASDGSTLDTAAKQGFLSGGGTVVVNGTEYAYTGISGLQLTGLSGLPAFTQDFGVMHKYDTTGFTLQSSQPSTGNIVYFKNSRIYVAQGGSVYLSKLENYTSFAFSAPRVAGEGEIVQIANEKINALIDRGGYTLVSCKNFNGSIEIQDFSENLSDIPVINQVQGLGPGPEVGAVNAKGTATNKNRAILTSSDIGMVDVARAEANESDQLLALAERVRPDLENYDFTDPAAAIFRRRAYNSARSSSSVSHNDRIVVYDTKDDWLAEWVGLNATSFTVWENKLYFADSLTKNVRQMNVEGRYDDDDNPYLVHAKTIWFSQKMDEETGELVDDPMRLGEMKHFYIEGWISSADILTIILNFNEGGRLGTKEYTIEGDDSYVKFASNKAAFARNPFGIRGFANVGQPSNIPDRHFRRWIPTNLFRQYKFNNFQIEVKCGNEGQNWAITRMGVFIRALPYEKAYNNAPQS